MAPVVGQRLKIACSLFKISKSKGEEGELSKRIRPFKREEEQRGRRPRQSGHVEVSDNS